MAAGPLVTKQFEMAGWLSGNGFLLLILGERAVTTDPTLTGSVPVRAISISIFVSFYFMPCSFLSLLCLYLLVFFLLEYLLASL
jgi:hypothetical protein